ncbi:MAG: molybdopterin molybdotransferase MoeA [Actinomycetota bacterium]
MISLEEARTRILAAVQPLPARPHSRPDARGLVLAETIHAGEPVPPFANTAMDGYAVRAADTEGAPVRLHVVGELPAGRPPTTPVGPGEAIRIMTGAPVPDGADAIVMVERTQPEGDKVLVREAARRGDHIRAAGGDVQPGAVVFEPGTVLTPAHLGVLASLDVANVVCHPRARVGVVSTGDELVEHGPLAAGQIRDSNRPMLLAVLAEAGCEPVDYGIARDDRQEIETRLTSALGECDALLTSGAVSVGDYDFVKVVLERLASARPGSTYEWSQVAIRPAKPLAFGVIGGRPVFGLPGNPVSGRVSFELFARPALNALMGHTDAGGTVVRATAAAPMRRSPDGKLHLDRVRVRTEGGRFVCERAGVQASNVLSGMAAANGLALLPDGEGVSAGAEVEVLLLGR